MRKPSRHPLITFFVVFAFLAQVTGISGCAEAEKAYKEATGQTVVDDSVVRAKLATVNEMSESIYDKILLISQDAAIAQERANAQDSDGMMAAFDRMAINNDAMMSSINELNAAEETLQKQKDAARQGGPEVSQQFLPIILGTLGAAIALGTYLAPACKKVSDLRTKRDKEPDPLKAAETQNEMNKEGGEISGKVVTTVYSAAAGFAGTGAGHVADAIVALTDTGNSGATAPKVIASSTSCASTLNGTSPTDTGCKLYIGKATTTGNKHTIPNIPVDTSDITIFPKNVARVIIKGVITAKDAITALQNALIKISDATAKNIKASDAGTYTAPSDGGGTTTPADFPRTYAGYEDFKATFVGGSCTGHVRLVIVLQADGTLTATLPDGIDGCQAYYDDGGAAGYGIGGITRLGGTGTYSGGDYTLLSGVATTNGTFDANYLSGHGSSSYVSWSFTLDRQ